jgi:hypothetical protein
VQSSSEGRQWPPACVKATWGGFVHATLDEGARCMGSMRHGKVHQRTVRTWLCTREGRARRWPKQHTLGNGSRASGACYARKNHHRTLGSGIAVAQRGQHDDLARGNQSAQDGMHVGSVGSGAAVAGAGAKR